MGECGVFGEECACVSVSCGLVWGKKCAAVLLGRMSHGLQELCAEVASLAAGRIGSVVRMCARGAVCARASSARTAEKCSGADR